MAPPSYDFYKNNYMGDSIPETEFARYALRADTEVLGFERTYTVMGEPDQRNMAVCAIADAFFAADMLASAVLPVNANGNLATTKVSVGSVSTSTSSVNPAALGIDMTEAGQRKLYYSLLKKHMKVYRGVS